jgi:histone H3/H4
MQITRKCLSSYLMEFQTVPVRRILRRRVALRVRAQGAESDWVFPSKRSKTGHITRTAIEKPFRKASKDTKLPKASGRLRNICTRSSRIWLRL